MSALQSALTTIRLNNYGSLAVLTAVGYDYVLTFSSEIEYIWSKPWTWVSTMFILVRYAGLYSLAASEFSQIMYTVLSWSLLLFLGAADYVMILRVWAMYNRSRVILGALLALFSLEVIFIAISAILNSNPKNLQVAVYSILPDLSVCAVQLGLPVWTKVFTVLQIIHGVTLCVLAVVRSSKEFLQTYRLKKQWKLNQYMGLLVKQGIIYFLVISLFSLMNVLAISGKLPTEGWGLVLAGIVAAVPVYTLTPRFIMSIRELYARDVQFGRESGIDTGFGLSTGRGAVGTIVFADVERNEESEDVEQMPMDNLTTRPE